MATKQISIPEVGTVTLYKRRGNRSLRLSISHDGAIRVSLPYWLPYEAGEQFVLSKASWIAANRATTAPEILEDGCAIGKAHRLRLIAKADVTTVSTRLAPNEIRVTYPTTYEAGDFAVQEAAHKACIRALRSEAEMLLPMRLQTLSIKTSLSYTSVGIKQLKSRWGSCTSRKEITLNLFLMQLPWHLIDYVLVHELTHTKVMQHGAPFWAEMERHLPDAKRLRKYMRAYQPALKPQN